MAKFVKSDRDIPDLNMELNNNKKVEIKTTEKINKKERGPFKGVRKETKKIVWPDKKKMIKYSIAVILFIIFFALFFYVIELLMAYLEAGV